MHWYFAYGSNMNPARVRRRQMPFEHFHGAVLHDYRLVFNKRSVILPGAASANVTSAPGHRVEGVLYHLPDGDSIAMMDPFEGYPHRYSRQRLPVHHRGQSFDAWVYLANPGYIQEGLRPARWYLEHLLQGRPHLSPAYFEALAATECLPDTETEPA